jgi:hypothetical protein
LFCIKTFPKSCAVKETHVLEPKVYMSELQPPVGLLFIPNLMKYEHRDPWWNDDDDRGILLIYPQELAGSPTSSYLIASRRNENLALQSIFVHTFK